MKRCLASLLFVSVALLAGCQRARSPQVVVYVAVDRRDAEPILKSFEAESGVRVLALYDAEAAKTTGLVTRLMAEAKQPGCDVFWNNEVVQTLLLADRGLLDTYVSRAAQDIPEDWKDAAGRWTGIATRARVIVYNTRYVKPENAPRRLADLTQPQWRGRVAIANPQFGTTRAHVAALFAAWGPEPAQQFLRGLLANEARIVDGNAMVKNLVARARPDASPIFVGLTDTDDVLAGQAAGEPVAMVLPDQDELGTLVLPSTVCLIRGAPHPDAARRLIDYLLSAETGRRFAAPDSGYTPVRAEATAAGPRRLPVTFSQVFEHLAASSEWTAEHFSSSGW